jgi:hypothetical protein
VSKSNGRLFFAGNTHHRGGSVTVIETSVARSYWRRAKIAFFVVASVVGLLTAIVAADYLHPILALLLGILAGGVAGAIVAAVIAAWPVLRALWHWAAEIAAAAGVVYGWIALTEATNTVVTLGVVGLVVGLPAAIPASRRRVAAWAWCAIVRHRLRLCFAAFVAANRQGTLPLILLARPTPAGERVSIWLRPGLALSDLENKLDKLAVACWANEVRVTRGSRTRAALIRVDIARHNPFTGDIASPLPGLIPKPAPTPLVPVADWPTDGLNLLDVPDEPPAAPAQHSNRKPRPSPAADPTSEPAASGGDDVSAFL